MINDPYSIIWRSFYSPFQGSDAFLAIVLFVLVFLLAFFVVGWVWGKCWNRKWSLFSHLGHSFLIGFLSLLIALLACVWYGVNNNSLSSKSVAVVLEKSFVIPISILEKIKTDEGGIVRTKLCEILPKVAGFGNTILLSDGVISPDSDDNKDKVLKTVADKTIDAAKIVTADSLRQDPKGATAYFLLSDFSPRINVSALMENYATEHADADGTVDATPTNELHPFLAMTLDEFTKEYAKQGSVTLVAFRSAYDITKWLLLGLAIVLFFFYVPVAALADIRANKN